MQSLSSRVLSCAVAVLVAGAAFAQVPESHNAVPAGPRGEVPAATAAVLLDQPVSGQNLNAYADQDFEATYDTYDIFIADDFTVPAGGWTIEALFFENGTWNAGIDLTCATLLHVQIYADAAGVPDGDPYGGGNPPIWSLAVAPTDAQVTLSTGTDGFLSSVLFTLAVPVSFPAGTYWITYYPEMDFATCGQHGRQVSETTNGGAAMVINPGGGFGFPTTWASMTDSWAITQQDLAMRIEGQVGLPDADLSLVKTAAPVAAHPGEPVVYTLQAANAGPIDATGVVVTDPLPAGVTYVSDTCGGVWDGGTGVWTWTIGALASGANASCDVTVTVTAVVAGDISNTGSVTGNENDPDTGNNDGTALFAVVPLADVSIVKTSDAAGVVYPGDQVTYTLAVANGGPSGATGVEVTDALPAGVTYVSDTCGGVWDGGTGVWTWTIGTLAGGAGTSCGVTVSVAAGAVGTITNTANVGGTTDDPDAGNNISSTDILVEASADLAVIKTSGAGGPVGPGDQVVYTLDVSNGGPSGATGVEVTDALPAGVTYVSDTCGGVWDGGAGVWTWTVGTLADGGGATCDLTVVVAADALEGTIVNTASAAGDEADPDDANSSASTEIQVVVDALPIPLLSPAGGALVLLLLAGAGLAVLRSRM